MVAGYSGIADCIAVIGRNDYVLCAVSEGIDLDPSDECGYGHGDACGEGLTGYIIGEGCGYGGGACCNADHGCGSAVHYYVRTHAVELGGVFYPVQEACEILRFNK